MNSENLLLRSKMMYLCAGPFLKLLNKSSIPYAIIKGEPLSVFAYKKNGNRFFGDIDVLVQRKYIKYLDSYLREVGFYQDDNYEIPLRERQIFSLAGSHQTVSYKKRIDPFSVNIDINFDVLWGEYTGKRLDIGDFLSDTVLLEIYGQKIRTLPPIKMVIQLILHHYKDMNSIYLLATRNSINYTMLKDVYYLIVSNLDQITVEDMYLACARYDIVPYVFYVLYYTGQVFDNEALQKFIDAFRTPEGESLLNCYGLCESERKIWKCDFETRLYQDNMLPLFYGDLSRRDIEKIEMNKKFFGEGM